MPPTANTTTAARMPRIAITTRSSVRVKPFSDFRSSHTRYIIGESSFFSVKGCSAPRVVPSLEGPPYGAPHTHFGRSDLVLRHISGFSTGQRVTDQLVTSTCAPGVGLSTKLTTARTRRVLSTLPMNVTVRPDAGTEMIGTVEESAGGSHSPMLRTTVPRDSRTRVDKPNSRSKRASGA